MQSVELIAILAVVQFLAFGVLTGRAREQSGVKAPATSGHPVFDRMYRVQMNTLELLVAFFPALLLAARHAPAPWVAGIGLVYLIGRVLYWRAYVRDPSTRAVGFVLSIVPIFVLLAIALIGTLGSLFG